MSGLTSIPKPGRKVPGGLLVLDGSEVKLRLLAERQETKSPVHVDWLRFTTLRRNAPTASLDHLFPKVEAKTTSIWETATRCDDIKRSLAQLPDCDFDASAQAYELATQTAQALGPDFVVSSEFKKGHDFYKFRWGIERHGSECGWVGFLASGDKPRQQAQSKTLHVNLFGAACTFAAAGWTERIADIIDDCAAVITRADLALDFFDGLPGGLDSIVSEYKSGLCNVGGKQLKSNCVGDWLNGKERSLYFGSKEAGKQTNCYEKGHQLFGPQSGSDWLRVELRYGNKLRVLSSDLLRRPADFFAGASDWHASTLLKAAEIVSPEPVKCAPRLQTETVLAECSRSVRWAVETASATLATAFKYLSDDQFLELVTNRKKPGRLDKFSDTEVRSCYSKAWDRLHSFVSPSVESCSPAFA